MRVTLFVLCYCMLLSKLYSQNSTPVPEFKNTVQLVSVNKKALENLEKTEGRIVNKVKALGFAGENYFLRIPNGTSTKIIKSKQPVFVVKLPDSTTDPNSYVSLLVLEAKKKTREIKIGKGNVMGMGGSRQVSIDKVNINFTKVSAGNYLITLLDILKTGSYGFALDFSSNSDFENKKVITMFAFDIE